MMTLRLGFIILIAFILGACTAESSNEDSAGQMVEEYLQAKVDSDEDTIRRLICSELEASITREVSSFASVEASIEGMSCTSEGNIVSCTGEIVAVYGTENREFPLTSYSVVQEDGEWRWCGEGE
ncbi:MAG: hypothetical protein Phog2KO_00090 [Phototrophicaceae bacterium]